MIGVNSFIAIIPILLLIGVSNVDSAIRIFAISAPWFSLIIFSAVGHSFRLPEITAIALILSVLTLVITNKHRLTLPKIPFILLIGFYISGIIGIVSLGLFPDAILTHPYNTALDPFPKQIASISSDNFTQTLLRTFTLGIIVLLASIMTRRRLRIIIRYTILNSLLVIGIELVNKIMSVLEIDMYYEFANRLGFMIWKPLRPTIEPIPRSYSITGEPGATGLFLVLVLGIIIVPALKGEPNGYVTSKEARIISALILVSIVTNSSGTAIGGVIILFAAVATYGVLTDTKQLINKVTVIISFTISLIVVLAVISSTFASDISYIFTKLTFSSGSGPIRLQYMMFAVDTVQARPLFGLGFGSYYGASLIGTMLVETGIVGLSLYILFHISIFIHSFKMSISGQSDTIDTRMARDLTIGGSTVFCTALVAKSITAFLLPWYWIIIASSAGLLCIHGSDKS